MDRMLWHQSELGRSDSRTICEASATEGICASAQRASEAHRRAFEKFTYDVVLPSEMCCKAIKMATFSTRTGLVLPVANSGCDY